MKWIAVQEGAEGFALTERVLHFYKRRPILFKDEEELRGLCPKEGIILFKKKGSFIKRARYAEGTYHLVYAQNCLLGCCYCFLRSYFDSPFVKLAVNKEDLLAEIKSVPEGVFLHALDLSEPFLFEEATGYLADIIARLPSKVVLEVRTKREDVAPLLELNIRENVVISWTILPSSLIKELEKGTAPFQRRVEAAKKAYERGYRIAFHFDPLVYTKNFKEIYKECIKELSFLFPYPIDYITVGTLRIPPPLYRILLDEGRSISKHEFFLKDGLLRYPKPLRLTLYRILLKEVKDNLSVKKIYICDETKGVRTLLEEEFDNVF